MNQIFSTAIEWPESSILRISTADNQAMIIHIPILKWRWTLFRENPDEAVQILCSLTKNEVQAVLLYAYSNLPAKRSLIPVFQRCGLSHPQSLQESTFVEDMRSLMHDESTCDFRLVAEEPDCSIPVHRSILAARSAYFRALFSTHSLELQQGVWTPEQPIPYASLKFFVEYLYTGQIAEPKTIQLIPLHWLVRYLRLSGEKEVESIIVSALVRELNAENSADISRCAQQWNVKSVLEVVEKFDAMRK